jgi:hypothetical protein
MTTRSRSKRVPVVTAVLRQALGRLEDGACAAGWAWDAELSNRVDHLLVLLEAPGA